MPTHPHAFRHSRPSSIARPVTHKKSRPPSSCIAPTGMRIISSSVRVPYGSCAGQCTRSVSVRQPDDGTGLAVGKKLYLLMDCPWRICDQHVILAKDRYIKVPQVDVDPLRWEDLQPLLTSASRRGRTAAITHKELTLTRSTASLRDGTGAGGTSTSQANGSSRIQ